jgi:hypothetical protein
MSLLLGTLIATTVRLLIPAVGVWTADVDVTLDDVTKIPSGKTVLQIRDRKLQCTVDDASSGRFGETFRARVVGGAGGWSSPVPARDYANDAGVMTSTVFSTTAAAVGETIQVPTPERLGVHYVRQAGPAAQVLSSVAWYVDFDGITHVGARPSQVLSADHTVMSWDALTHIATIGADDLIEPGTVLTDSRFDTITVREIEQIFQADGARATAFCDNGSDPQLSPLMVALYAAARAATGSKFLARYRYRIVQEKPGGRLSLQAVNKSAGIPDALPISIWPGFQGISGHVAPGAIVLVDFVEGNPALPIVTAFEDGTPIELRLEALQITLNGSGDARPVARLGDTVQAGPYAGTITSGSLTVKAG